MKHIKKKYAFRKRKLPVKPNSSVLSVDRRDYNTLKNVDKNENFAFMKDISGHYILSTLHNNQGKELIIPIPDLSLVYYDSAYMNNYERKSFNSDLFKKLSQTSEVTEDISHELYRYINYAATSVIMMFSSLESFLNSLIPEDGSYKLKRKVFDKKGIERYVTFEDKILKVIPSFESKAFFQDKNDFKTSHIGKLKNLRDEIIHTKSSFMFQNQSELLKQLLNFEFDETLLMVKEYMNSYKPNYIEDCPCNKNF